MALRTPEFLQTKTYSAMRDRLVLQHGGTVQAGVWDAGDFKVTQRAAGANMSVDVAVGFALVSANDPGNAGLYHVQNDATFNVTLQTNGAAWAVGSGTNPRIDRVVLLINDTTDGGDASDVPTIAVVQGTATAGATLDNLLGASAVPNGALLLADALMPTSSTTVTTANIRDRRPWARGVYYNVTSTPANNIATAQSGSTTPVDITGSGFQPRIECSGSPIRLTFNADVGNDTANGTVVLWPRQDGTFAPGVSSNPTYAPWHTILKTASAVTNTTGIYTWTPAAGSHLINVAFAAQVTGNAFIATNGSTISMTIEELVRPSANNT